MLASQLTMDKIKDSPQQPSGLRQILMRLNMTLIRSRHRPQAVDGLPPMSSRMLRDIGLQQHKDAMHLPDVWDLLPK